MDNQEMNYDQSNMNQPKPRMRLGFFICPLLIDYGVTILMQLLICFVLFAGVFSTYVDENPEVSAYIDGEIEMEDSFYDYLTTEVVDDLTEEMYIILDQYYLLITVISSMTLVPIFMWLMKRDKVKYNMQNIVDRQRQEVWKYLFIVTGSITLCVALNNIINLSQLASISQYYQEASQTLYSQSYIVQLLAYGLLTPFAEEYLFRGVIYNRLRVYVTPKKAMIWSAVVFGVYHANLVQMIYAGICGLALVWIYERYGTLKAPILAHMCLNLTSIVLTQYDIFAWIFNNQMRMMTITVGCAALTATIYVLLDNMTKQNIEMDNQEMRS